ncbi:hypothetical protein [Microbulbifer rhizosphaerae]|uniref:Uncharacterized protein n=1 Tax=Microbulbifer rhizosphaerae TaxID=1562603 RepID=A0A7W4Z9K7_9GAMM|nr:hypothetical protein [Microbulbifer rhizosphaerae]MBB3061782.1 hypothetical protein [Microbulbifer rhizosphaerae]
MNGIEREDSVYSPYLAVILLCATFLATIYLASNEEQQMGDSAYRMNTAYEERPAVQAAKEQSREAPELQHPELVPVQLAAGEEVQILGQKLRLREVRDSAGSGEIRNLEFVFRRGILPRRLFDDSRNLIVNYRQLYRNNVGYGAAAIFLYYEVITRDSDGDGLLSYRDGVDVAVSRPDGSEYRVLDQNLERVIGVEYFPAENVLQLELEADGLKSNRTYAL